MAKPFHARLGAARQKVESLLDELLAPGSGGVGDVPPRLLEAMRYAALSGGKRLRPFLVVESARLFSDRDSGVTRVAAALECVHCYSLIHDDLPAMDDDNLRRGRPTVHRAFDEATAILAGDALLTFAFEILADPQTHADGEVRSVLIARLAAAAGMGGMVGGQTLDLVSEHADLPEADIRTLQAMKTGALFRFACDAGALHAGAGVSDQAALARFGAQLGAAFQIADDLIDATGNADAAGKRTGKDAARGKATLVALHGVQATRSLLAETVAEATATLAPYGARAQVLQAAVNSLVA
ncbi:MAG: polyprenyl synthetase family protein [Alphaproteobacteria bacterium]